MSAPCASQEDANNESITLTTWALLTGLYIMQFVVNLNRAITATLVPSLTDVFGTQTDVALYVSIYNLTGSVAILFFCKLSNIWTAHGVTLTAVVCCIIGSVISGMANSSAVFVVGRFVAGLGMAGATTGVMTILHAVVPERHIPVVIGVFMTASSGATVAGPVIGGAIEGTLSWRWAFYIDPILCVVPAAVLILTLSNHSTNVKEKDKDSSIFQKAWRLDPFGNTCIASSATCLLLFLQFGGSVFAWNDGRMIGLAVVSLVTFVAFVYSQHHYPGVAVIPPRLVADPEIRLIVVFATITGGVVVIASFFLPQWYQIQLGVSAKQAGINVLPLAISTAISGIITGVSVKSFRISYATLATIGISLAAIASGVATLITRHDPSATMIGIQILLGVSVGTSLPLPHLAIRNILPSEDLSTGTAVMIFAQMIGSSILATVAQLALWLKLQHDLAGKYGIDTGGFDRLGATALLATVVQADDRAVVLDIWNAAFGRAFYVSLGTSAVGVLVALALLYSSQKRERVALLNQDTSHDGA